MNQVANTVILPVEEYAALSAKLAKAQLEVERLAHEVQKVKDWNAMLADHNEQLAQRGDDLIERLARQVPPDCVVVPREATQEKITSQEPMLPIG